MAPLRGADQSFQRRRAMERIVRVAVFLVVAVSWGPHRANACGDYCGDWGALYYTGGYNLFDFGMNLYGAENFAYTDYGYGSWGGGCGGYTSSCTSAYDNFSYQVVIDTYTTLSGMCGISCGGSTDPFRLLNTYSPWTPMLAWNDWSPNPFMMPPAVPISNPFIPLAPIPTQNPFPISPPLLPPNGLVPLPPVTFDPYVPTTQVGPF